MKKVILQKWKTVIAILLVAVMATQLLGTESVVVKGASNEVSLDLKLLNGSNTPEGVFDVFQLTSRIQENKLKLGMKFSLNDDRKSELYENSPFFNDPVNAGDLNNDAAVNGAAPNQLTPITFQVTCKMGNRLNLSAAIPLDTPLEFKTAGNEVIGSYTIHNNNDGSFTISGAFQNMVYIRYGVSASLEFEMDINALNTEGAKPEASIEGDKVSLTVDFSDVPGGGDIPPMDYKLTKSAPVKLDLDAVTASGRPEIPYTMEASAVLKPSAPAGAPVRLNGCTIQDILPGGVELVKAEVEYNKDGIKLPLADSDYILNGQSFSYQLPDYDAAASNGISNAQLYLTTALTPEKYQEFTQSKTGAGIEFKNKAALLAAGVANPVTGSNETATKLEGKFFDKTGKQSGINGHDYDWTIKGKTFFSSAASVYVIDALDDCDNTHKYKDTDNDGIPDDFNVNGVSMAVEKINSTVGYAELTAAKAKELMQGVAPGKAAYYRNGNQEVMIIPIVAINRPFTITYQTQVQNITEVTETKTLKNKAGILWDQAKYGSGPGIDIKWADVGLEKTETPNYSVIKKLAGTYDEKNQQMKWSVELNRNGMAMPNVVVTDILVDENQKFSDTLLAANLDYQVSRNGVAVNIPYDATAITGQYYRFDTSDPGKTKLILSLGDVNADEVYVIPIETTITDKTILSQQSAKAGTVKNKASVSYGTGPVVSKDTAEIVKTIKNVLIEKNPLKLDGTTVGSQYDYAAHATNWEIKANPNRIAITDGVVTDILPEGAVYDGLLAVTGTKKDGTVITGALGIPQADGTTEITFPAPDDDVKLVLAKQLDVSGKKVFQIRTLPKTGNSVTTDTSFTIKYRTSYEEGYRQQTFRDFENHKLTNTAELTGTVNGQPILVKDVKAVHTVMVTPVDKTGVYGGNNNTGFYADWKLVFNKDGYDMAGVVIEDKLEPIFEMDLDSLRVYRIHVKPDGTYTYSQSDEITADAASAMKTAYEGFSFRVPENVRRDSLLFEFRTMVIDTAGKTDMKNHVSLTWDNGDVAVNKDKEANNAQAFDIMDFATAAKIPMVQLLKVSSNSKGMDGASSYPVAGASFSMTAMQESGGTWMKMPGGKAKTAVSKDSGILNFLFLKNNTLYQMTESQVPLGYEGQKEADGSAKQWYVVFKDTSYTNPVTPYPQGTIVMEVDDNLMKQTVTNTPKGSVRFQKKTEDGAVLKNVVFQLTPEGANSGKVKSVTAKSDANGSVAFQNLDAGSYTLTETTPEGFIKNDDIPVIVTLNTDGTYQFALDSVNPAVSGSFQEGYTVTNTHVRGTVTVRKTDIAAVPISGAEFIVYNSADYPVAYLTEAVSQPGSYTLSATNKAGTKLQSKTAQGYAYLSKTSRLLYGDYYLRETTVPDGYSPEYENGALKKYPFTIGSTSENPELTVINNAGANILGQKVDETGIGVAGAEIGLFLAGTQEFTRDNLFHGISVFSQTAGAFTFQNIPFGTYIVAEIAPPPGYEWNQETRHSVMLDKTEQTDKLAIVNKKLPEAQGTESIVIQKTSDDEKVMGFTFTIKDETGATQEYITNQKGMITASSLKPGTYWISEKATEASARYQLPKTQKVLLTKGGAWVEFHNRLLLEGEDQEKDDQEEEKSEGDESHENPPGEHRQEGTVKVKSKTGSDSIKKVSLKVLKNTVKTGDNLPIEIFAGTFLAAMAVIVVCLVRRRKKSK